MACQDCVDSSRACCRLRKTDGLALIYGQIHNPQLALQASIELIYLFKDSSMDFGPLEYGEDIDDERQRGSGGATRSDSRGVCIYFAMGRS
jgi:hypothetical protein